MNKNSITIAIVALSVGISTTILPNAIAGDVRVSTDKVKATTHSNGSVYVDTAKTSVSVPVRRTWYPWHSWRTPWRGNCRQGGYQNTTTQTTRGNGSVTRQSSTTSYCR